MITVSSLDNTYQDLNHYEKIARILARELPGLSLASEPIAVSDSIENLSDEMTAMPEVIQDVRLATEAFDELDGAIGHMYALADRSAELPEDTSRQRAILDGEFRGYSHIVARLAGADDFEGPRLSLATKGQALAARKILGYLNEARSGFTRKLADQRRQINDAMDEALSMLGQLVSEGEDLSCDGRERLRDLLNRLPVTVENYQLEPPRRQRWLH